MRLFLDTGIVGQLCHPNCKPDLSRWYERLMSEASNTTVMLAEITDYEHRRVVTLLHAREPKKWQVSLDRLNQMTALLDYVPLKTSVMRQAAEFWAKARMEKKKDEKDPRIDIDVILAAQAADEQGVVVTDNVKDFYFLVPTKRWQELDPGSL